MNKPEGPRTRVSAWLRVFVLAVFALAMVTACQAADTPEPTELPPPPATAAPTQPPPEPTPLPDQSAQLAAWEGGNHNFYSIEHGPNTWCARCHSPQNWDPEAFRGPPPSCFTCKFPHEEEMREAEGNPFVSEEEWVGIPCETCHRVDENGIADANVAWFNPITESYMEVSNTTELCEKCHVTTTGNSFGSAVDHKITLGGSAHLNYGGFLGEVSPPTVCSDCHDPHSTEPPDCEDCHAEVLTSTTHMKGMNAIMLEKVTCLACHDASGLDVGPHPDEEMGGIFITQVTEVGRGGPSTTAVISHSIVFDVACDRCHFEDNPWELTVLTAEGEIPEPVEEGDG